MENYPKDNYYRILKEGLTKIISPKESALINLGYTETDFSNMLIPLIYQELKRKEMKWIDSLNARGTHRDILKIEIREKLDQTS